MSRRRHGARSARPRSMASVGRSRAIFWHGPMPNNPMLCKVCFGKMADQPGGAEIPISVVFADVRGSTALAERTSASEFHGLIQAYYRSAAVAIDENGGIIDKFLGDGVMALFIPFISGESHASRAIMAGRAILAAVERDGLAEKGLLVGAGVHTGEAFVGVVGGAEKIDFTALGDTVNIAARLGSLAGPGELLVSRAAWDEAGLGRPPSSATSRSPGGSGTCRWSRRAQPSSPSAEQAMSTTPPILERAGYELEVEDTFAGPSLDERLWFPHHLAGWSSREASAAHYEVDGGLRLRIDADQPPWSPEFDGGHAPRRSRPGSTPGRSGAASARSISATGLSSARNRGASRSTRRSTGSRGSLSRHRRPGQHGRPVDDRFRGRADQIGRDLRLREFGRDVAPRRPRSGWASIRSAIRRSATNSRPRRSPSTHAERTLFGALDQHRSRVLRRDRLVKVVDQSPAYPMQFMLDIYEFSDGPGLPSPRPLPEGLRGRVVPRLSAGRRTGCAAAGVPPLIDQSPDMRAVVRVNVHTGGGCWLVPGAFIC